MKKERVYHYLDYGDFQFGTGNPAIVLCGESSEDDETLAASSNIYLVSCSVCKSLHGVRELNIKDDLILLSRIKKQIEK